MKRSYLLVVLLLVVAIAGWYGYNKLYGKVESLHTVQADYTLTAAELITAFEKDSATANRQYLGKVIAVKGSVKSVEKESDAATVVLGKQDEMAAIRCSVDSTQTQAAGNLQTGSMAIVKGVCTGYYPDDLGLGADVVLNRCVLDTKE